MQISGRHVDRPVKGEFTGTISADGVIQVSDENALDFWLNVQLDMHEIAALKQPVSEALLANQGSLEGLPHSLREWANKVEEAMREVKVRKAVVASPKDPDKYEITLDQDWNDCERGNILLINSESERFNAWLHQGDDIWLEVIWVPDNYPALNVTLTRTTVEALWEHLVKTFDGTTIVRKLNLGDHTSLELEEAWRQKYEEENG